MTWMIAGCSLFAPTREAEADPAPARPYQQPPPSEAAPCTEDTFTVAVRRSGAIDASLIAKFRVVGPVCIGDFGYAGISLGEGQDGAVAIFQREHGEWRVLDLGTGLDCSEPAPPVTPGLCAELERRWSEGRR